MGNSTKLTRFLSLMAMIAVMILAVPATSVFAQNSRQVSGKVADAAGNPIIGATVMVEGTNRGTTTDVQGNFNIEVAGDAVLSISYIGYSTQNVAVGNRTRIDVILSEDSTLLDDVVVVGYGVQRRSDVTGAISSVKASDFENRAITRAEQALQGKTAGVQLITTSGQPGASPSIRIRGVSSNSTMDPLYVVDGLRVRPSDVGGLDPNIIESMEVLKDAASAAIYGVSAGNGVVLITTKRGTQGTSKISYDFQYTVQSLAKTPKLLNADQYIEYMLEGGYFTQTKLDTYYDGVTDTDWLDVAFENGIMQRHNLQFQGANDKGSYFLSLSYLNNDGIVTGNKDTYKRLTANLNADYRVKPWLRVGMTANIEKWNQTTISTTGEYGGVLTAALTLDPLTPNIYKADNLPSYISDLINGGNALLTNKNGDYYGVSMFYEAETYHPLIARDNFTYEDNNFNVSGTIFGDFTPIKNLTITSRFGYRLSSTSNNGFNRIFWASSQGKRDNYTANGAAGNMIYYQWENFANYTLKINKHNLTAMAGLSFNERYNFNLSGSVNEISKPENPSFWYISYQTSGATKTITGGTPSKSADFSYFGRLSYDYDGKYILQASLRADAADLSKLSKDARWGYFPAISAGWVASNENFFPKNTPVTYAKLRASWGRNGSTAALGNYSWRSGIGSNYSYVYEDIVYSTGSAPTYNGNADLKWETHEQIDIGLDARFLRDRLTFSIDWYKKTTKDLLVSGATPTLSLGTSASPINAGDVENKGFEFELGWRDRVGDFSYSINANLATLKNKVTYLHPSITRLSGTGFHTYGGLSVFEAGYPAWYFRGYKFDGIDPVTGEPTIVDIDNSGDITDSDKTMIGSGIPDFTYGITLSAAWKGIDLTVFGTGSHGNDIWMCLSRPDRSGGNIIHWLYKDRWTPENTSGSRPKAGTALVEQYLTSDAMVFNGSYFKIKQIQLGYTLPKHITQKAFIDNLRVYVSLEDFFTFTSYPGFDPEVSVGATSGMGFDKGNYPISKKVIFGLNLTF